ncbi:hypothetical protein [Streptomyces sp. NPDC001401]|uniref:hypothetical protein n=1 Tax=Streptomyces sp. NPDC001401 TaxID=3364570 RepID=UPI003698C9DC
MHSPHKAATMAAGMVLGAGGLIIGSTSTAQATTADCDAGWVADVYGTVGGGSSFTYAGRLVQMQNGRARNYSHGIILGGYRAGDRIWTDRSRNKMPANVMHPSTAQVQSIGSGWKQCGPFDGAKTNSVINWDTANVRHYAARVCIDPVGSTPYQCGSWYTDAS